MRYDESYSFLNFIAVDWENVFYYPLPNNHVFHSMLTKITTTIWGGSPAIIRLVAFFAGITAIPLMYLLCKKFKSSGIFASTAIAIMPYLIFYSTNARGYTLVVSFTIILIYIAKTFFDQLTFKRIMIFSIVSSLGILTMPSMIYPVLGIISWIVLGIISRGVLNISVMKRITSLIIFTIISTGVLYIPVIVVSGGVSSIVNNRFVKPLSDLEFYKRIIPHLNNTFSAFTNDISSILIFMSIILGLLGFYVYIKQKNWTDLLLVPTIFFTSSVIFIVSKRIPFERTWIFLIPFVLIVCDAGYSFIISKLSSKIQWLNFITLYFLASFLSISLLAKDSIKYYRETGLFLEAEIVAKYLKSFLDTNDIIYVKVPGDWPVYYYLWYNNAPMIKPDNLTNSPCHYVITQNSIYSIDDVTNNSYVKLFEYDNVGIYKLDNVK